MYYYDAILLQEMFFENNFVEILSTLICAFFDLCIFILILFLFYFLYLADENIKLSLSIILI